VLGTVNGLRFGAAFGHLAAPAGGSDCACDGYLFTRSCRDNIATLYLRTKFIVIDDHGAALANYIVMNPSACPRGFTCTQGTHAGAGGGGGVGVSIRQWRAAVGVDLWH